MRTAPSTAATRAVPTGAVEVSTPMATPVRATCPRPSPSRDSRRCTRKTPTAGAARPTISDASSARCMKSYVRMCTSAAPLAGVGADPRLVDPVGAALAAGGVGSVVVPAAGPRLGPRERAVVADAAGVDDDRAVQHPGERPGLVSDDEQRRAGGLDLGQQGG